MTELKGVLVDLLHLLHTPYYFFLLRILAIYDAKNIHFWYILLDYFTTRPSFNPLDNFGTVVGENPDCLLLSGTVVGENPDHVYWESSL